MTDTGSPPPPLPPEHASADEATAPAGARAAVGAGIRWGLIDQTVQVVARLGTSVALARLIAPRDFGVFGFALVVLNFGLVLSGLGLGSALVQRRELTRRHVTTAFTASSLFGCVLAAMIAAASIPASAFFREPRLRTLLPLLGLTFVMRGLEVTPNDMLTRSMRFRSYYISSTIATIVASLVGLTVGATGGGVYALVAMMITESTLACVLAWFFALRERVWRPSFGFDGRAFRDLAGFSAYVTASGMVGWGKDNGDNLVVGRALGATDLGYYAMAYRVMLLPLQRFGEVVAASAYPALATVQDDPERLRTGYVEAMRYVAAVCSPVTIGIAVTAPVAVPLVLGPQWTPAVTPLQILALSGPFLSVSRLTGTLTRAVGKANWGFWLDAAGLAVYVPAFLVGVRFGLVGVAAAFGVATLVMTGPEFRVAMRALGVGWRALAAPLAPIALATAAMAAVAAATLAVLEPLAAAPALFAAVVSGGLVYVGVLRWKAPDLVEHGRRLLGRGR